MRGLGADLIAAMQDRSTHQLPLPLALDITPVVAGESSSAARTGWRQKARDPRTQTAQGRSRRNTATKEVG
ncbi:MAG: hypothetical protein EA356_01065 [Geminicoccaceae bacterium]|nr:MAG: hypothetical protein EA356_01065 [Geminicoccaceae bacterium]